MCVVFMRIINTKRIISEKFTTHQRPENRIGEFGFLQTSKCNTNLVVNRKFLSFVRAYTHRRLKFNKNLKKKNNNNNFNGFALKGASEFSGL